MPRVALLALVLPLVAVLVVAVHEAGHLLAARLVDFRSRLLLAGPLRLELTGSRVHAGLNRDARFSAGLAVSVPLGLHDLRRRTMVMLAGGPVLSLMFGVQCLALHVALSPLLLRDEAGLTAWLAGSALVFLGIGSLLTGLLSLLPTGSAGFHSDGARLLRLLRPGEDAAREVALLTLTALTLGGVRPRDWEPALVERGAAVRDGGPFEVEGRRFAYAHALDRGEIGAARGHLEAALAGLEHLPRAARGSLLLSAATFVALHDGDAAGASGYLRSAGDRSPAGAPHQRALAEAAIRATEGDVPGADAAARVAQRLAGEALDRGMAALDADLAAGLRLSAGSGSL